MRLIVLLLWCISFIYIGCEHEPWVSIQSTQVKADIKNTQVDVSNTDHIHVPTTLQKVGRHLKQSLPQIKNSIEMQLGIKVPPVEIYISHSEQDMKSQAEKQEGYRPPEWAHGLAYARSRHIYLHNMAHAELNRVCMHELIHIALGQQKRIPRWINEGFAVIISEGISWERMLTMQQATLVGGVLPFRSLIHRFPSSGTQAQLAYAQSSHMLSWLRDRYGIKTLQKWLHALMQGQEMTQASQTHFNQAWVRIENQWSREVAKSPLETLAFFTQETTLFFIAILIFLIGGFRTIRQRKKQRALLDVNLPEITIRYPEE